jgi:hypothetical protein
MRDDPTVWLSGQLRRNNIGSLIINELHLMEAVGRVSASVMLSGRWFPLVVEVGSQW